ncbi:hypothetical protein SAMN04489735_100237 [Aneurinibacillus thermoaerophilus]|uniref:Uncharacterized protein n=1 Tax=Aneurinibacillus thermoaerophilus TaxID=143495 RepID=A0A1G7WP60_ANETH|nr:hypothetical protein SAMN04489735_100237 [Aneurinibacillus thermoaerophilus]
MLEKKKQKRLDFVKYLNDDYTIVIARHPRFHWMSHTESNYVYFLYITRTQNRFIDEKTAAVARYNILCFQQIYSSYSCLMKSLYAVISEYLLDANKILEVFLLCEKLREQYGEQQVLRD